jgi:hypothetical protein
MLPLFIPPLDVRLSSIALIQNLPRRSLLLLLLCLLILFPSPWFPNGQFNEFVCTDKDTCEDYERQQSLQHFLLE